MTTELERALDQIAEPVQQRGPILRPRLFRGLAQAADLVASAAEPHQMAAATDRAWRLRMGTICGSALQLAQDCAATLEACGGPQRLHVVIDLECRDGLRQIDPRHFRPREDVRVRAQSRGIVERAYADSGAEGVARNRSKPRCGNRRIDRCRVGGRFRWGLRLPAAHPKAA